jgi:uncharacterized protein
VIAIDTNILVYAHRRDSTRHTEACRVVKERAEGSAPWSIPWPCIHEFLAVVTHPRVFDLPKVHDARIAALSAFHLVTELWTADRDFQRFPGVPVKNPLV